MTKKPILKQVDYLCFTRVGSAIGTHRARAWDDVNDAVCHYARCSREIANIDIAGVNVDRIL